MDQRALDFAGKFNNMVLEIDAGEFEFDGIDENVQEFRTSIVFLPLLRSYVVARSEARRHPSTISRYM